MLSLEGVAGVLFFVLAVVVVFKHTRRRARTTSLRGPPRPSFVYGCAKVIEAAENQALPYEQWSKEYGLVYQLPSPLGKSKIIVMDPKAISHIYGKDTYGYQHTPLGSLSLTLLVSGIRSTACYCISIRMQG